MTFEICWDELTLSEWDQLFAALPRPNLLQTWPYAQTMRASQQLMTRFGVIRKNGKNAGVLQIQEIKLFGLLHIVTLDRGPLWFDGYGSPQDWCDFFECFDAAFPKRLGRFRRVMPETPPLEPLDSHLKSLNFKAKSSGYQSIWLDLRPELQTIRSGLKQKWRNRLNAAEKTDIQIRCDDAHLHIDWLIDQYMEDRRLKKYAGASPKIIRNLFNYSDPRNETLLLRATQNNDTIAAILVFKHGRSATYQIGWSGALGRKTNAHYLLLWSAIESLQNDGIDWFDLGGINLEQAEGVTKFKQGLGGEDFQLIGLYT